MAVHLSSRMSREGKTRDNAPIMTAPLTNKDSAAPSHRSCYCGLWQSSPQHLRDQGIPEGYCGICQRCGALGHTRHFPGPVPYTGAWCDACYRTIFWQALPLRLMPWSLLAGMVAILWWFVSRHIP